MIELLYDRQLADLKKISLQAKSTIELGTKGASIVVADSDLTKSIGRFVPSLHDVVFHSVIRVDLIMADGHQDLTSVVFHQRLSTGQALRLTDTKSIFFNVHMQTVSF